jgi:hypothetical protein
MAAGIENIAPELQSQTKAVMLQFLQAELEIAKTFISVANATARLENRARTCHQARKAYETVVRMMTRVQLSSSETAFLSGKLALLKIALQQLGEKF